MSFCQQLSLVFMICAWFSTRWETVCLRWGQRSNHHLLHIPASHRKLHIQVYSELTVLFRLFRKENVLIVVQEAVLLVVLFVMIVTGEVAVVWSTSSISSSLVVLVVVVGVEIIIGVLHPRVVVVVVKVIGIMWLAVLTFVVVVYSCSMSLEVMVVLV